MIRNSKGHIVAKADVIHGASQQVLLILLCHIQIVALALPIFKDMLWVKAVHMDSCKVIALLHGFLCQEDILRVASRWVNGTHGNHTANLKVWVDVMPNLDCTS